MRAHTKALGLTLGLLAGAAACSSSNSTAPNGGGTGGTGSGESTTITASSTTTGGGAYGAGGNYYFTPNPDTVATGTSVTFTIGSVTHNVHFDSGPSLPDSIPASTNTSVSRTFAAAGTYTFHCSIHNFSGVLVVH